MVTKDRDIMHKELTTLRMSKDVVSKSNVELYEKLNKQKNAEQEVAIKNLTVAKERYIVLEKKYKALEEKCKALEEKHAKSLKDNACLLYTSPSPRDRQKSRMPSSA